MQTQLSSVSLLVCGIRPARIDIDKQSGTYAVTSPACELSLIFPDAVYEVHHSLASATELCECLLVPVFDDDINNPTLGSVPRLQLVGTLFDVSNDDDQRVFANMHVRFSYGCDLFKAETSYELIAAVSVSVPDINVIEHFENFKSAYDFCLKLSSPSKSHLLYI